MERRRICASIHHKHLPCDYLTTTGLYLIQLLSICSKRTLQSTMYGATQTTQLDDMHIPILWSVLPLTFTYSRSVVRPRSMFKIIQTMHYENVSRVNQARKVNVRMEIAIHDV
jgi:hypothetical protein